MQDRYSGDIGDFLKLALLDVIPPSKRLAVCWWLHPDESHNDDGRHVSYLSKPDQWKLIAPFLFDDLVNLVRIGNRSVSGLESIIGGSAIFHRTTIPTKRARFQNRDGWFSQLMMVVKSADVLFIDPDNGIDLRDDADKRKSAKHVTMSELSSLAAGGRTLIIYHHQTRAKGGHALEISKICESLRQLKLGKVSAVRARPFSPRVFFIIGPDDEIHHSLEDFVGEFPDVYEHHADSAGTIVSVSKGWNAQILTLYPEMFPGPLGISLAGRALEEGRWSCSPIHIRDFATDKHRTVDDTPAGGGAGMVLRADILSAAVDFAVGEMATKILPGTGRGTARSVVEGAHRQAGANAERWDPSVSPDGLPPPRAGEELIAPILAMTPRGVPITQARIRELAAGPGVTILCGRFEGFDERLFDAHPEIEQVSMGDIILSGGEVGALMLLDACIRLLPGVMGATSSGDEESFEQGLLEYPHYTRPADWEGRLIPEVLRSGDHAKIAAWRKQQAEADTRLRRPDLWERYNDARDRSASDARRKKKD